VQPESVACADDAPSLTVITHVDELKPERSMRKRPSEAAVPIGVPSIVIVAFGAAPVPSTRSWPPFSSARVTVIAASAAGAATSNSRTPASNATPARDLTSPRYTAVAARRFY